MGLTDGLVSQVLTSASSPAASVEDEVTPTLVRAKEQSNDWGSLMVAQAARMSPSMALLGWSMLRQSWMS
jgi:hypothetical protein